MLLSVWMKRSVVRESRHLQVNPSWSCRDLRCANLINCGEREDCCIAIWYTDRTICKWYNHRWRSPQIATFHVSYMLIMWSMVCGLCDSWSMDCIIAPVHTRDRWMIGSVVTRIACHDCYAYSVICDVLIAPLWCSHIEIIPISTLSVDTLIAKHQSYHNGKSHRGMKMCNRDTSSILRFNNNVIHDRLCSGHDMCIVCDTWDRIHVLVVYDPVIKIGPCIAARHDKLTQSAILPCDWSNLHQWSI